jgi:hypothetical protein
MGLGVGQLAVRDGRGPASSGCGGTALRRRPALCVPNAKAAGRAAAQQRRDSPPTPATYGGTRHCPAPPVTRAPIPGALPGPDGPSAEAPPSRRRPGPWLAAATGTSPTAASKSVAPHRVGGRHWNALIDGITLSDGIPLRERARTRPLGAPATAWCCASGGVQMS